MGIIVIQWYWVQKAFDQKEKQFNQTIHIALQRVAERMAEFNKNTLPNENPVNQISSDYFVVNLNDVIDANVLEHYMRTEFDYRNINIDFEYAIYDCTSDKMMYGDYINITEDKVEEEPSGDLPKMDEFIYYFGVHFPTKSTYLVSKMGIWVFFSFILVLTIIFFGYALFVILKQKRLWEVQRDFINNMTHEFKTPVSTISLSADVLSDPAIVNDPNKLLNYAAIIKEENNRIRNQVERVLQIADMEKEEFRLKKEVVNLHELINGVIQNLSLRLKQQNGSVECHLDASTPEITADKVHLTNIIYNLLDNAIKYTQDQAKVVISTGNKEGRLVLSIEDNGTGIKKEHQKKIFDKFFRVSTGNVHNVKGFGLGLHYVKNVVNAHRWRIRLESEWEQGSKFIIDMPAAA